MRWSLASFALVLVVAGCTPGAPSEPVSSGPPASPASAAPVSTTPPAPPATSNGPGEAAGVRYLERVTGGAAASDALPMVVAIHGFGDDPAAFRRLFEGFPGRARFVFPYGEPAQQGYAWWPISGPRLDLDRVASGCDRAAARLAGMIEALVKAKPSAGGGRAIVTGFSQGGMLSFTLAVLHPDLVAEAYPVSGLLAPALWPTTWPMGRVQTPIFALHGDADERVPIDLARKSVDKLRKVGFSAELREYPGVGHTVSPEMRRDLFARLGEAIDRAAKR